MSKQDYITGARKARFATLAAVGLLYPAGALFAAICATAMFSGTGFA